MDRSSKIHTAKRRSRLLTTASISLLVMSLLVWALWMGLSRRVGRNIILYGAFGGGRYSQSMQYLANYLQRYFGDHYLFMVKNSEGSIKNVRDLQSGKAHIALVQEDVAYYFYRGGHNILKVGHQKDNKVNAIGFLCWEYLYIFANPSKKTLSDLQHVHIGSLYSGNGITAINLREQLQQSWNFVTEGDPLQQLKEGRVDAFMLVTADPSSTLARLSREETPFHLLGLKETEVAAMTASFNFYHEGKIKVPSIQEGEKKYSLSTIATRALLSIHQKIPPPIVAAIVELVRNPESGEYQNLVNASPEGENLFSDAPLKPLFDADGSMTEFPLPMHPVVFEQRMEGNPYLPFFLSLVPLLSIFFLIVYMRHKKRYSRFLKEKGIWGISFRSMFEAFWVYLLLVLFVLVYLLASVYTIKYLEIQDFLDNQKEPSPFVHMNFRQLFTWTIVFTVASYEDEIFPTTELGKLIASSVRLVAIGTVMFIIGRLSADYVKNLIKGRSMKEGYNLKDHIVICNWNKKAEKIIQEVHSSLLRSTNMFRPVVVICEGELKFPETPEFEDTFCIPGDPLSGWKLRNANVHDAHAVIILSDANKGENADTHTIMIAMEIAEIIEEKMRTEKLPRKPHISAEISDGQKQKYLQRAGVDEIVSSNEIGVKLLAQTAVTPGITAFMNDILEYSAETNEIYIIDPPKGLIEDNASFSEISQYFIEKRDRYAQALLVGIYSGNPPKMLVNPDSKSFSGLTQGDKLVVIARQRPSFD